MVRDAEAHADEDKKRREQIEARNAADSMIYAAEKALREAGDKVDGPTRTEVEDKIRETRASLDSENSEEIRNRTAELGVAMQKVGQAMYADQGGAGQPQDDDVVEGEYKAD